VLARDAKLPTQQRLGRGGAHAHEDLRAHGGDLGVQPGTARPDLFRARALVDPALASAFPLEVLHHVGDVDVVANDPRTLECLVEDATRRSHERPAEDVFLVAGLLTDEHQPGAPGPFAEDHLGGPAPQVTRSTVPGVHRQLVQGPRRR
jgi:hypothetical protein